MESVQSVSPPWRPADASFSGRQGVRRRRHAIILLKVFEHRLRELMRERPHRRAFEKLAFLQQGAQPAHTEFMVGENRAWLNAPIARKGALSQCQAENIIQVSWQSRRRTHVDCFSLMSNTTISLGSQVIDPSRLSSNAGTRLSSSQLYPSNGRRVGFFFYVSIAPSRSRLPYVVSPTLVLRACNSFKQCRGRLNGWITLAIPYLGCHGMQEASCA